MMEQLKWYRGKVEHGFQNGRKLGFPTANIVDIQPDSNIGTGIYAVMVKMGKKEYCGMMYVGTRPTLSLSVFSVEIHLFDFDGDLYGQEVFFSIMAKIREEQQFASVDELMIQLQEDEQVIRQFFRQR
ncbi:MAG: riboflavin kinase [Bacteroidales bacterium]|jgi:riboflavin kinase / FMN adenylyltransferase|nr:riboflavin kinase [Bacteroidales bacterium]MDD4394624.1 riboflavin kinase [Bacteroidales bacterium]